MPILIAIHEVVLNKDRSSCVLTITVVIVEDKDTIKDQYPSQTRPKGVLVP